MVGKGEAAPSTDLVNPIAMLKEGMDQWFATVPYKTREEFRSEGRHIAKAWTEIVSTFEQQAAGLPAERFADLRKMRATCNRFELWFWHTDPIFCRP